ncbi:FmdB family zinc ribbon protein [Demequina aurantiaca]|uniref:FmdB family zinc ribbon protein n=1 Tax=Demequina aurantiaca TaxID=676200 RepID=UPI003D32AC4D
MPTYTYSCNACQHRFDEVQSIHDDALATCPECGGSLRKVFGSVGVAFKGSGFYRNDSRDSRKSTPSSSTSSTSSSSSTTTGSNKSSSS